MNEGKLEKLIFYLHSSVNEFYLAEINITAFPTMFFLLEVLKDFLIFVIKYKKIKLNDDQSKRPQFKDMD